jgi:hypothetical protein
MDSNKNLMLVKFVKRPHSADSAFFEQALFLAQAADLNQNSVVADVP